MKIAILGSNGFLGRNLAIALDANPENKLILFDKNASDENLTKKHHQFIGDITELVTVKELAKLINDCDVICFKIGLLGLPSISSDISYLGRYLDVNANSFMHLMERCAKINPAFWGKTSLLVDSSVMRFGGAGELFVDEMTRPEIPENYYGLSKHALEDFCQFLIANHNAKIHILRYSRVTSAATKNVISALIDKAISGTDLVLSGSMLKLFNFVHVADVTNLSLALIDKPKASAIWHCGGAYEITLPILANAVLDTVPSKSKVVITDEPSIMKGEVERLHFSDSITRKAIGLAKAITLKSIIAETFTEQLK